MNVTSSKIVSSTLVALIVVIAIGVGALSYLNIESYKNTLIKVKGEQIRQIAANGSMIFDWLLTNIHFYDQG